MSPALGPPTAFPHAVGGFPLPHARRVAKILFAALPSAVADSAYPFAFRGAAGVLVVVFVSLGAMRLASLPMILSEGVLAGGDDF